MNYLKIFFCFLAISVIGIIFMLMFVNAHENAHKTACEELGGTATIDYSYPKSITTCSKLNDTESKRLFALVSGIIEEYDYRFLGVYILGLAILWFEFYNFLK